MSAVCDSFAYQVAVAGEAHVRVLTPQHTVEPVMGPFYRAAVTATVRSRAAFLRTLVQRVLPETAVVGKFV